MGHDQHGPAYPEPPKAPYRCPICRGDEFRYGECEYAGCPDGRDRGHPHAVYRETYDGPAYAGQPLIITILGWVVAVGLLVFAFWPTKAPAMDHGFDPNNKTVQWMEKLQKPYEPGSCCGKGDGYPVSDYWANSDGTGSYTVVIGDGSAKLYPDGTRREYIATGTEINIPGKYINPPADDLDNPTDVSWLFMSVYAATPGTLYCFVPHPQGN